MEPIENPYPMTPALRNIALADMYSAYRDSMPRLADESLALEVKRDILELLSTSELIDFATRCPSGWPATHCMHFCTVEAPDLRPIVYLSTKQHTRKVRNVRADPRVSLAAYRGHGFEGRRKTRATQLQAVCTVIEDGEEFEFALDRMRAKAGYDFTSLLDLEGQAMLRAEPVFALWQDNSRRPQRVTVDYRSTLTAQDGPGRTK
ncbi:MAG: pyridoxamine 5'-phosphate oxidase family protein [Steroidobacteraceae bacterium]